MKTIKIIELLNKIANGEDVPEKVKYKNEIYYYEEDEADYYGGGIYLLYKGFDNNIEMFLKDEVEIVEDTDNKIEKIDSSQSAYIDVGEVIEKINELIDEVNMIEDNMNHIPRID